ncbi:MAG TPA: nitrilase-related carbon-nitrogen hydrolase, partial [Gemmatimonadaceae bacterium]|nr:nitrilase-related carbon-nitrogen hydrolase [Gemmatimonadaceae bacterium]
MTAIRIALVNVRYPATPDESVSLATRAIADAGAAGADIICFPECFIPGYRGMGHTPPPPDAAFLEGAWSAVAAAAREANVAVVVGTERLLGDRLVISTLVV